MATFVLKTHMLVIAVTIHSDAVVRDLLFVVPTTFVEFSLSQVRDMVSIIAWGAEDLKNKCDSSSQ